MDDKALDRAIEEYIADAMIEERPDDVAALLSYYEERTDDDSH